MHFYSPCRSGSKMSRLLRTGLVTLVHCASSLQLHPHTSSPMDLWTDPTNKVTALLARWTEKLAGGPQARRSGSPH